MSTVTNNRISTTIDAAVLTQVRDAFKNLNNFMPFLVGLNPDERASLPKISVANKQFVADALSALQNNPSIFPSYISPVELGKDLSLYNQLDDLVTLSQQLTEKLRDTQILAGSEAYVTALSVYRLIEAASMAGMPGADTIYEQLAERFAGQGNKGSTTTPPPSTN